MKYPHLPTAVLQLKDQQEAADAFGLRSVSHEFIEIYKDTLLNKISFQQGTKTYDPYSVKREQGATEGNQLFYEHTGETLTLLERERDLTLWERILPYPWGFIKGVHKKNPTSLFAQPTSFQKEWETFFALLNEVETILSSAEIAALCIMGNSASASFTMRFLRKKCVGISFDPTAHSLHKRHVNGGLVSQDLFELWGTTSCFFSLKMNSFSPDTALNQINVDLKQALQTPSNLVRYRIATLEDGVIEMGL